MKNLTLLFAFLKGIRKIDFTTIPLVASPHQSLPKFAIFVQEP